MNTLIEVIFDQSHKEVGYDILLKRGKTKFLVKSFFDHDEGYLFADKLASLLGDCPINIKSEKI